MSRLVGRHIRSNA